MNGMAGNATLLLPAICGYSCQPAMMASILTQAANYRNIRVCKLTAKWDGIHEKHDS
jgi:hypothetical protein